MDFYGQWPWKRPRAQAGNRGEQGGTPRQGSRRISATLNKNVQGWGMPQSQDSELEEIHAGREEVAHTQRIHPCLSRKVP